MVQIPRISSWYLTNKNAITQEVWPWNRKASCKISHILPSLIFSYISPVAIHPLQYWGWGWRYQKGTNKSKVPVLVRSCKGLSTWVCQGGSDLWSPVCSWLTKCGLAMKLARSLFMEWSGNFTSTSELSIGRSTVGAVHWRWRRGRGWQQAYWQWYGNRQWMDNGQWQSVPLAADARFTISRCMLLLLLLRGLRRQ